MALEWRNLRIWNGSQESAFEELVCQLAHYESVPSGSDFVRKAAPDAGLECFWKLGTGAEYGWQAKFFTSPPSFGQWQQVNSSIDTALAKHPALKQYTVCMAIDRADPRLDGAKSFLDRWNEHVAKWEGLALGHGMHVDFRYWGNHEIFERLSREDHRGRHFFWFHEELFGPSWFDQRLREAIAAVGPRYTPELNINLPISGLFDGLSRSPDFLLRMQTAYGDVGKAWSKGSLRSLEEAAPELLQSLSQRFAQVIDMAKRHDKPGVDYIDWPALSRGLEDLLSRISEADSILSDLSEKQRQAKASTTSARPNGYAGDDPYGYARYSLRRIQEKVYSLQDFVASDSSQLANRPALLIVGSAGTGKTHLLSDAASRMIQAASPAVLLLGSQFRDEEPWAQMLRLLGLSCTREEFLGALEAAAQLSGRRALILIDALNEGEGRSGWEVYLPSMLACLARYPWIGIVLSVRNSYEKIVIPEGLVPGKLMRSVHSGFAENAYEAAKAYFGFYGIQLPAVPILVPEFQNPLFLSCFCRGLHNSGLTTVPPGMRGISSIFDFFLRSVNQKLAKPRSLDYDEKSNPVEKAVTSVARWLSERLSYAIPREEARAICESILPSHGFDKSLLSQMISEGVLAETISYEDRDQHREMISFSYERLGDHLVMRQLLAKYVPREDPTPAFGPGRPMGSLFRDEMACYRNHGLAEALAIQGPEVLDKEIFELLPTLADSDPVGEAFIESLLWRDPTTISERCLPYINERILGRTDLDQKLMDALLTVSPNPEHPFNADFLHANLIKRPMPERDAWWSTFLYGQYGARGSVDRLVDWASSDVSKKNIADESIRLLGKALIWFLTTSHRFLRDRATKALVALFVDRMHVLCRVIPDFVEVNDPYVAERLYAVAYGCALRSNDAASKQGLAQLVYDIVFKDGLPPCHVLLRDYARGVVEVAIRDGLKLVGVEADKIRPPYRSKWPLEIPTKEEVEKYGEWSQGMPDEKWALHSIYDSVMGSGDFARYVIGSDWHILKWSSRRLGEPRLPSRKDKYEAFVSSLTQRQRKLWADYLGISHAIEVYRSIEASTKNEKRIAKVSEKQLQAVGNQAERALRKSLGQKKAAALSGDVLAYLKAGPKAKDEFALPVELAQRWVFKRVIDLGWKVDLFGRFDRNRDRYGDSGRSSNKAERVGKKYQWIAYHEFLAHMADNLELRQDTWSDEPETYAGPWQLWLRDIDPSCLARRTLRAGWEPNMTAWWAPVKHDDWEQEQDDVLWRRRIDLLPNIGGLPIVADPQTGRQWLVLECLYDWEEPTPPEKDRFDTPRRHIWYMLKSYLVRQKEEERLFNWAKDQHFMGRWMPESHEQTRVFLGEYFWSPAFLHFDAPYYSRDGWTRGHKPKLPCEVLVTTDEYMQEQGNYDCSIDDTISIHLPTKWISDKMGLSWGGVEGCFFNASGQMAAQDPSLRSSGPAALLVDLEIFSTFLESESCRLVWTVLGEKDVRGGRERNEDWPGRMELSGCIRMKDGHLDGVATAWWLSQGPERSVIGSVDIC